MSTPSTPHPVDQPTGTSADELAHTVSCWFGCGYLAENETDLDEHEAECARADQLELTFYDSTEEFLAGLDALIDDVAAPRPVRRTSGTGGVL